MNVLLLILTFLLTLVLIIGLLAFVEKRSKKKNRLILETSLDQLIKENKLLLQDIEFFGRRAIGLDKKNKKLGFVDYADNVVNKFCVDLNNIFFSRVNEIRDESSGDIKEVSIELKKKNYDESLELPFYKRVSDNAYIKKPLIKKANYWKDKINLYKRRSKIHAQFEYVL